jgi:hypothetical protein
VFLAQNQASWPVFGPDQRIDVDRICSIFDFFTDFAGEFRVACHLL